MLKQGGTYYMTYSASHCAASLGPWTKTENNPLAQTDPEKGILRAGA